MTRAPSIERARLELCGYSRFFTGELLTKTGKNKRSDCYLRCDPYAS